MTVTDSRRTGTSIYNISRVKQTTGWRRRSETPANLRGGLGRARAATGTTGMAATARLGPAHRLPAIRDGVGVAMLPLPVAPKATAGGKRCGQDRWLSTTSTSWVWFLGGLGFRLPPQSLSASLRRQRAAKLLPRHTNQACLSQKNTGKEKKKKTHQKTRGLFLVEDGAAGSKGWQGRQPGGTAGMAEEDAPAAGMEGMEEGGLEKGGTGGDEGTGERGGGPSPWSLGAASQTLFAFLISGPGGHLGVLAKPMFFRTFLQKKTAALCSGLGRVKLTVWKSLFQDPIPYYRFKGKYEFNSFKEIWR